MPILLTAGYTSSIYLDGAGFTFPCGDSTPLIPMEAFKNQFYLDSTPVGRTTSADGKVHVYLFRRSDGQGIAAFWNTSQDACDRSAFPVQGRCKLFDVFGNPLGALTHGKNSVTLNDRFVRYAAGRRSELADEGPDLRSRLQEHSGLEPASDPGRHDAGLPVASHRDEGV